MRLISLLAICTAAAAPCQVAAAGFADLGAIDGAVARFTGADIGTPGGALHPVDRRLRLAQCRSSLALEWYGKSRDTVLVRCSDVGGWRLFVPVAGGSSALAERDVVTRGETISILVRGKGFTLTRQAEALEGGPLGAWIRVRVMGNKAEPLRARVLQPGKVGMDLP